MDSPELAIWLLMLGGLLTLGGAAVGEVIANRSAASWRSLGFLLLVGTSCVMFSGILEDLFPSLPVLPQMVLLCGLGPLGGALSLHYLGQWLGTAAEDRWVYYCIQWGSYALVLAAVGLTFLAVMFTGTDPAPLFLVAALVNGVSILLASFASMRAVFLGDALARWMMLACAFLAISIGGLFTHRLNHGEMPTWTLFMTAFSTVAYFQVVVTLSLRRVRQQKRLDRLSNLASGADPATGLPRGSILLAKVDDAFWRSERQNADCAVICVHLRNLYALGEEAGHGVDQQILTVMAARVRRAAGFRCIVGMYHPMCFVVVISAVRSPRIVQHTLERLNILLSRPMTLMDQKDQTHAYRPDYCIGVVNVPPGTADKPSRVIDRAEQKALAHSTFGFSEKTSTSDEQNPRRSREADAPTQAAPLAAE